MAAPRYISNANDSDKDDARKLEALASLSSGVEIADTHKAALQGSVTKSLRDSKAALDRVRGIVKGKGKELEVPDEDPDQARLNLQLALNRLVSDQDAQEMARTEGKKFQRLHNLTNDQMLTLCRLAVDVGAYQKTDDLNQYIDAFKDLGPAVKALSPGVLGKLGLSPEELAKLGIDAAEDGLIGSCSCCCP